MAGYLEFEVSLQEIKPRIWRRFQIADSASFGDLHRAIGTSFGWDGGHLWEFVDSRRDVLAGFVADFIEHFDEPPPDAEKVKLLSYFPRARSCVYHYDFGDGWMHAVKLRERGKSPGRFHRRLLAGERACPPEDCGGVPGYYRFVSVIETGVDPWDDDVEDLKEWLGKWDPAAFDIEEQKRVFDSSKRARPWY